MVHRKASVKKHKTKFVTSDQIAAIGFKGILVRSSDELRCQRFNSERDFYHVQCGTFWRPYMVRSYRSFFGLLCLSVVIAPAAIAPAQDGSSQYHVNSQRLQSTLVKLSEYGRNPDGGVTRLGYSETDMAAREYVIGLMKDI